MTVGMFPALDISASGLVAQRTRMTTIASNLANISTTHNERGEAEPYQPRFVIFQTDASVGGNGAAGVKVSSVETDATRAETEIRAGQPRRHQRGRQQRLRRLSQHQHDGRVHRRPGGLAGL